METANSMDTRGELLAGLKQGLGGWVSGQSLSERLSITRSAIWKQVKALKDDGYVIEASPRKGYRLCEVPDLLLVREIRNGLTAEVFGRKDIRYFRQTDSTNLRARELAARNAPEGTVVIAEEQTQGRGRRQRSWYSPPRQGIYVSLILRPAIPPTEAPRITLLTAVAVADALMSLMPLAVRIKWPNDILVRGKKIAGILTEISTGMDAIDYIVIGLGVNINIPAIGFPEELRPVATSILIETGAPAIRSPFLCRYLECFEHYYDIFRTQGFDPVMRRWKELSEMQDSRIRVDMIDRQHVGTVAGFDRDGFLILRNDEGESIRIFSGDVTIL